MQLSDIEFEEDDEDLDVEARLDGRRIGYIWCVRDADRLKVSDLHVEPEFRRHGIGGRLLRMVLTSADKEGVREVWGLVTQEDLKRWPNLTSWYQHLGFTVMDATAADREDVPDAVNRIVRRRHASPA